MSKPCWRCACSLVDFALSLPDCPVLVDTRRLGPFSGALCRPCPRAVSDKAWRNFDGIGARASVRCPTFLAESEERCDGFFRHGKRFRNACQARSAEQNARRDLWSDVPAQRERAIRQAGATTQRTFVRRSQANLPSSTVAWRMRLYAHGGLGY